MKHLQIRKFSFKNDGSCHGHTECKMHLKIQQKFRCLGCISKQTIRSAVKKTSLNSSKDDFLMKSFPSYTKRKLSIPLNFLFPFFFCLLTNGVFFTLTCRTLVIARQPFCWKWVSFFIIDFREVLECIAISEEGVCKTRNRPGTPR